MLPLDSTRNLLFGFFALSSLSPRQGIVEQLELFAGRRLMETPCLLCRCSSISSSRLLSVLFAGTIRVNLSRGDDGG